MLDTVADLVIIIVGTGMVIFYFLKWTMAYLGPKRAEVKMHEIQEVEYSARLAAENSWSNTGKQVAEKFSFKENLDANGMAGIKGEYVHYLIDMLARPHLEELWELNVRYGRMTPDQRFAAARECAQHIDAHRQTLVEVGYDLDDLERQMLDVE